jgi:hypothetical protein
VITNVHSQIDNFIFHMGINATSVVGRVKLCQPISNTPGRLSIDLEKARALCVKLEDELISEDEDGHAEEDKSKDKEEEDRDGSKAEKSGSVEKEKKIVGMRERGSDIIHDRIERIAEGLGLGGEDLTVEEKVQKVSFVI